MMRNFPLGSCCRFSLYSPYITVTCKLDASKCLFLIVGIHIRACGCLHICVCVCVHALRIISQDKIFRCINYNNNDDDEDYNNNNYIIDIKTTVVLWLVLICLGN